MNNMNTQVLNQLKQTDLYTLSLGELLESLDRLLEQVDPQTYQSLMPGASDEDLQRLEIEVKRQQGLHPDLITWLRWHNGQALDSYRFLSPFSDRNTRIASVDEAIYILQRYRNESTSFKNWCPIAVVLYGDGNTYYSTGMFLSGDDSGQIKSFDALGKQADFNSLRDYVIAIIEYEMDRSTLPTAAQYWVQGVAAPSVELNRWESALPGGLYPLWKDGEVVDMLRDYWGVYTPENLTDMISSLMESEVVEQEDSKFGEPETVPTPLPAWDLCRASALAGFGRLLGWLTKEQAWQAQLECAQRIQAHYSSWQEMALDFVSARNNWMKEEVASTDPAIDRLFTFANSPFYLDWNTPLDSNFPVGPPIEVVTLGPQQNALLNSLLEQQRPRPIEIQLQPGTYTIDKTIRRGVKLSGSKVGSSIIKSNQADTLVIQGCGVILEDLRILCDVNTEGSNDIFVALHLVKKSYVRAYRCIINSTCAGISVGERSQLDLHNCSLQADLKSGFEVYDATVNVYDCDISGYTFGLLASGKTSALFINSNLYGGNEGARIERDQCFVGFKGCNIVGNADSAIVAFKGGMFSAEGCKIKSIQKTAIRSRKNEDAEESSAYLCKIIDCVLGPSGPQQNNLPCEIDVCERFVFSVYNSHIFGEVCCMGGVLNLIECKVEGTVWSQDGGDLFLGACVVNSSSYYSLSVKNNSIGLARDCQFGSGISVSESSKLALNSCRCENSVETLAACAINHSKLWLMNCDVVNDPAGHLKLPHLWPPQIPPVERRV